MEGSVNVRTKKLTHIHIYIYNYFDMRFYYQLVRIDLVDWLLYYTSKIYKDDMLWSCLMITVFLVYNVKLFEKMINFFQLINKNNFFFLSLIIDEQFPNCPFLLTLISSNSYTEEKFWKTIWLNFHLRASISVSQGTNSSLTTILHPSLSVCVCKLTPKKKVIVLLLSCTPLIFFKYCVSQFIINNLVESKTSQTVWQWLASA